MTAWPGDAAPIVADGYREGSSPEAERGDVGVWPRQADRATAPMRERTIRFRCADDLAAHDWLMWARRHCHRLFDWTDPSDGVTRRARVRNGLGGVRLTARVRPDGGRAWDGRAQLEGPA